MSGQIDRGRRALLFGGLAVACAPGAPAPSPPDAQLYVSSGDRFRIGASWAALAGVIAPRLGSGDAADEPLAAVARDRLGAILEAAGDALRPGIAGAPVDRWGRARAIPHVGETSVQALLLAEGLARVDPEPAARDAIAAEAWLDREASARTAGRGLWAAPYFAVRTPETVASAAGSFQLIEGVVVDAAEGGGAIYLNFGPDYRTDFTARLDRADRSAFPEDGAALLTLSGAPVRVRGWMELWNGPLVRLTEPSQFERL